MLGQSIEQFLWLITIKKLRNVVEVLQEVQKAVNVLN